MKNLNATTEMKKYQGIARQTLTDRNVVDVGAVQIGWNLQKGSVLVDTAKGFEFEIISDVPAAEGVVSIAATINGEKRNLTWKKSDVAKIILTQSIEVYYSR